MKTEQVDLGGKVCNFYVQDMEITYHIDELLRYLPDKTAFGHATIYQAYLKLITLVFESEGFTRSFK